MDIRGLKRHLSENPSKIQLILEELNCHHIRLHQGSEDSYFTFGNPDGDNPQAVTVYLTSSLLTINYTRSICSAKQNCDFLDLVIHYREEGLFETLQWITQVAEIDYYQDFENGELPLLKMLREIKEQIVKIRNEEEDDAPIKHRDEIILTYYFPYVNDIFLEDGISYGTQAEFGIGYDPLTNRITIPIRDEIGNLVGVKGRWFGRDVPDGEKKYFYLESCPRNKILFGYHNTKKYIDESDTIYLTEAEKGVLQFWSYGIKNVVGTGGTKVSQNQIDKLSRLGKRIVICFDKDFDMEKIQDLRNKFSELVEVYAVIDEDNILKEKESPSDNKENLLHLLNNNIYKIEKELQ